jgi:hypothetical protein
MTKQSWRTQAMQVTQGAGRSHSTPSMVTNWWPGITEPYCESCTWSYLGGVRQVKIINRACQVHGRHA